MGYSQQKGLDFNETFAPEKPEGFTEEIEDKKVLKLNKSLYGLKQAPRSWNIKLVMTFQEIGLKQLQTDNCLFVNNN